MLGSALDRQTDLNVELLTGPRFARLIRSRQASRPSRLVRRFLTIQFFPWRLLQPSFTRYKLKI